jgi:hypothetical protein
MRGFAMFDVVGGRRGGASASLRFEVSQAFVFSSSLVRI